MAPAIGAEHAFAAEAQALLKSLPGGHSHIRYSAPGPTDRPAVDFDGPGRLDVRVLKELGVPREADFYLCGPAAFMSGLTADLMSWGVPAARLHSENFGPGPALTPGVAAAPARAPHPPDRPAGVGPMVSFARSNLAVRWDSGVSEPARTGRGLRCAGALGLSHRRLPQLRDRTYRWRSRLSPRSARAAGGGQSPDLLQPAARRHRARSLEVARLVIVPGHHCDIPTLNDLAGIDGSGRSVGWLF